MAISPSLLLGSMPNDLINNSLIDTVDRKSADETVAEHVKTLDTFPAYCFERFFQLFMRDIFRNLFSDIVDE